MSPRLRCLMGERGASRAASSKACAASARRPMAVSATPMFVWMEGSGATASARRYVSMAAAESPPAGWVVPSITSPRPLSGGGSLGVEAQRLRGLQLGLVRPLLVVRLAEARPVRLAQRGVGAREPRVLAGGALQERDAVLDVSGQVPAVEERPALRVVGEGLCVRRGRPLDPAALLGRERHPP